MFKIYDGREHFYQWDTERKLIISDPEVTEVHFCNRTDDCSLVCETYVEDGVTLVNVPNILLQTDWKIKVYAFDGKYTKFAGCYEVASRTKPADYAYTETEILNWSKIDEKVTAAIEEANQATADAITATTGANEAAASAVNVASEAAASANDAANNANTAAEKAEIATANANIAADNANLITESKADILVFTSGAEKDYTITDSVERNIVGANVYGECIQNGTPTPEVPIDIESVENPTIRLYGKNLLNVNVVGHSNDDASAFSFDGNKFTAKGNVGDGSENSAISGQLMFPQCNQASIQADGLLLNAGTYTISFDYNLISQGANSSSIGVLVYDENSKVLISRSYSPGHRALKLTTTETQKIAVCFRMNNNHIELSNIQLELGETATEYEPYKTPQTVTLEGVTLRGLKKDDGSWYDRDEIVVDVNKGTVKHIQRISEWVVKSTWGFNKYAASATFKNAVALRREYSRYDNTIIGLLCNYAKNLPSGSANQPIGFANAYPQKDNIQYRYDGFGVSNGDEFIAFVKKCEDNGKPLTWYAARATPIETDCTNTEWGQALLKLSTNYPTTSILCDTDCSITYKADTTNAYNNLKSELETLTQAIISLGGNI